MDQWNRIESPEINPHFYRHFIFDRGNKHIQWAQDFFKWLGNWTDTCIKMKIYHFVRLHSRINSKCIKDLNIRLKGIKILEEIIGSKISDITYSNILSDISPQARETNERINNWKYIKLKYSCTAKETVGKIKI